MMILFIGNRGSGKTTIANKVAAGIDERGLTCIRQFPGLSRRPLGRALKTAIGLWRYFDFEMMRTLGFKGRAPRKIPSTYRLYLPLAFKRDIWQIKRNNADILIYDSNVLRALIAAVAHDTLDPREIVDFCERKILPAVDTLIIASLDTDADEAVKRWVARDNVTLSDDERNTIIDERNRLQRAADSVVKSLEATPGVVTVRLDGMDSPDDNATKILTAIESTRTT